MGQCPKCLSHEIAGPVYCSDGYGNESLRYDCQRCGYKKHKRTADSYDKGALPYSQTVVNAQRALAGKK